MRWYSRISLGLSLAVASAFLPAPCCCIPLRWHSCSSSESWEALAKERCNGRSTWRCGWRRFVMSLPASSPMYFPSTRRATSHEGRFIIFLGAMSALSISMGGRSAGPASKPCSVASFSQE